MHFIGKIIILIGFFSCVIQASEKQKNNDNISNKIVKTEQKTFLPTILKEPSDLQAIPREEKEFLIELIDGFFKGLGENYSKTNQDDDGKSQR